MNLTQNAARTSMLAAALLAVGTTAAGAAAITAQQDRSSDQKQPAMAPADKAEVEKIIASWPARPRLGATQMMVKYGPPQEATAEQLIWHNQGPFKRITVTKKEDPHDFPLPHMDFMEHTINYNLPPRAADALTAYDGSCTIDRTRGEMSARCDLEGHNILTLNLANDLLNEKITWEEAREQFGKTVVEDNMGRMPAYVMELQFTPPAESVAFVDEPVIPGSPVRASDAEAQPAAGNDQMSAAEALAFVVAVDMNEIHAAGVAQKKKISPEVMEYAKMLHMEHGKNMGETLKVGQQANARPVITPAVDALQVKGADQLAAIVPLDGAEFEKAYLDLMVKGHTEALEMIDNQLLPAASDEAVKEHLTMTREAIAKHLEKAKELQGRMQG